VLAGVRDRELELARDTVDAPLAVGQDVEDLDAAAARDRLPHRGERVEELVLRLQVDAAPHRLILITQWNH